MKKDNWLYEISFMRPVLLVLLVGYHAFAPFCGAWEIPIDVCHGFYGGGYKWIALFSRAFRLEAFVFVSGYVFAMQIIQKNKFTSVIELAKSKFIRLIIPCWIFGLVYWLMFRTTSPIVILKGIGHLWYLPCLFWCFLFTFFLYKKKWNEKFVVLSLLIISAISFLPLPMQLNRTMYYLLFFYLGGCAWKYSNFLVAKANFKTIFLLFLLFVILLVGVNLFKEYSLGLISSQGIIFKAAVLSVNNIAKAMLAFVGILTLFLIASLYMKNHVLHEKIIYVGTLGYGVYVFHQFILRWLYYNTSMPSVVGGILYPWIGLVVALVFSVLLTILFRKFELGRKLL